MVVVVFLLLMSLLIVFVECHWLWLVSGFSVSQWFSNSDSRRCAEIAVLAKQTVFLLLFVGVIALVFQQQITT